MVLKFSELASIDIGFSEAISHQGAFHDRKILLIGKFLTFLVRFFIK